MTYSIVDWIAGTVVLVATLIIPLAIRRWIVGRALSPMSAGLLAFGIWSGLFLFFWWAASLVDQQDAYSRKSHVGILAIAAISYWILTRSSKKAAPKIGLESSTGQDIGVVQLTNVPRKAMFSPAFAATFFAGIVIGYIGSLAFERLDRPRTYEDCVLDLLPKAKTREAAIIIRNACESKYKVSEVDDPFKPSSPKDDDPLEFVKPSNDIVDE